ncbi:hypothetical protein HELRODRAFT_161120 [Helobdella robusta]|uniref:Uncharacterized protein n=1 Tax=Helobdella robusta TaxID=6412 RepID=T1ER41_HELRO|nr:hypothetical protein HELRODRAFT_161120 [Helobdella robusta]ESO01918.1 hypothetical protein HELRODRAFT_161120 [Helobdella robusta]
MDQQLMMGADVTISSNETGMLLYERSGDASLFIRAAAFYATINMLLICLVVMCLMWMALRYFRRKEERDKLGEIIDQRFWKEENDIACLFQILKTMKTSIVFRDITTYHVLSYKYRTDNGVYAHEHARPNGTSSTNYTETTRAKDTRSKTKTNVFMILKKVERLFFSLCLQMPKSGKCSKHAATTLGSTILSIAQVTSLVWCDEKAVSIFNVVKYFSGKKWAIKLQETHVKDAVLETLVLSRIPYVTNLYLIDSNFILKEFSPESVQTSCANMFDVLQKISHIDHFLSHNYNKLETVRESIVSYYQQARELTFKNNLILTKAYFPDLSMIRNGGLAGRFKECVTSLSHLLRLISYGNNVKKLESDANFKTFVESFESTINELAKDMSRNMVTIEKTKENIVSFLQGLTSEHILTDKEFTKAKLELIEEDLKSHIKYLKSLKGETLKKGEASTSTKVDVGGEISSSSVIIHVAEEPLQRVTSSEKPSTSATERSKKKTTREQVEIRLETMESGRALVEEDEEEPYSETPV